MALSRPLFFLFYLNKRYINPSLTTIRETAGYHPHKQTKTDQDTSRVYKATKRKMHNTGIKEKKKKWAGYLYYFSGRVAHADGFLSLISLDTDRHPPNR